MAENSRQPRPFLTTEDVCELLGPPGRPLRPRTVYTWIHLSQPQKTGQKTVHRYADDPFPAPVYPNRREGSGGHGWHAMWLPGPGQTLDDLKADLKAWKGRRRRFMPDDNDPARTPRRRGRRAG